MEENKKPDVFQTKNDFQKQIDEANELTEKLNNEIFQKLQNEGVYKTLAEQTGNASPLQKEVSEGEKRAAAQMKAATDELIRIRQEKLKQIEAIEDPQERNRLLLSGADKPFVHRPDLAEPSAYQAEIEYGKGSNTPEVKLPYGSPTPPKVTFESNTPNVEEMAVKAPEPTSAELSSLELRLQAELEEKYEKLSQPQSNAPFDIIPLPSKGKMYANKKTTMKVAYLNASDENILTNPNLLQSGKFLEILINRKMLDTNLRYKDLHTGDRNAIMIWLRATGWGPEYPISVYDPATGKPFETNIDLSKLKMNELNVNTDSNGCIDYILPVSKQEVKFKLLTVSDIDDIEEHAEKVKAEVGDEFVDSSTYILKKHIVSINGHTEKEVVHSLIDYMRIADVKAFRAYVDEIESGMDMNLTVRTPGGESIKTFLPLNIRFFWPDLQV